MEAEMVGGDLHLLLGNVADFLVVEGLSPKGLVVWMMMVRVRRCSGLRAVAGGGGGG